MKRRLSFFISSLALAGLVAVAFQSMDTAQVKSGARELAQAAANGPAGESAKRSSWLKALFSEDTSEAGAASSKARSREFISCVIGAEYATQPEIRVWAFRNGHKYGWIQLPKGTPVRLQRREGDFLVVGYDEMTLKIHRSVAQAGLVVPVHSRTMQLAKL